MINIIHTLFGVSSNFRECHIKPDWLLIYTIDDEELELFLFRTVHTLIYLDNYKELFSYRTIIVCELFIILMLDTYFLMKD